MLPVMIAMAASAADAASCDRAMDPVAVALDGATALALRGVPGSVEIVGVDGDQIQATGTTCDDSVVRLVRRGTVVEATVRGRGDVAVTLQVPRTMTTVSVEAQVGPLVVRELPVRLAVVRGTGPVTVTDAHSLRVGYHAGDVEAANIVGDVTVDQLTGSVVAHSVGDLVADGVTGDVQRDGGGTAVTTVR